MDKRIVGENNILKSLKLIWDFGWLRPQELGLFIWQESKSPKKNAEALTRKLVDQKLVIARKLPLNCGTALFLSAQGAAALQQEGIVASSGKDNGRARDGSFFKNSKWKHHLLASGVLGHLNREGYGIIAEAAIRRKHNLSKFPDGIFFMEFSDEDEDGNVQGWQESYWLEVENHRKSGPKMDFMIESMLKSLKVNLLNDINEICGRTINSLAVAYPINSKDEKDNNINHKLRVTNAFKSIIRRDLPINFIGVENYGHGVSQIFETRVVVEASQ